MRGGSQSGVQALSLRASSRAKTPAHSRARISAQKVPSWGWGRKGCGRYDRGYRSQVPRSPERSGTRQLPESRGERRAEAPCSRCSRPSSRDSSGRNTKTTRRESGHARPDPGMRPGSDLTMVKAVVGRTRALAPLGLGLRSGKGKHRRLWTCCPPDRSRSRFASRQDGGPEPRLNRKLRRSKGGGRGAMGWGNCACKARARLGQEGIWLTQAMEPHTFVPSLIVSALV